MYFPLKWNGTNHLDFPLSGTGDYQALAAGKGREQGFPRPAPKIGIVLEEATLPLHHRRDRNGISVPRAGSML